HVMHRDLPRPSPRATPGALRYGRGSLLCITWISPRQSPMRGHDWTRKGGRNWKRIDRPKRRKAPAGAFRRSSLLHFYSGAPMHFLSGVDTLQRSFSPRTNRRIASGVIAVAIIG